MPSSGCRYCGRVCFVFRIMPDDARWNAGRGVHLATCAEGAQNDRQTTGYDHRTALNPFNTPQNVPVVPASIDAAELNARGLRIRAHAVALGGGPRPDLRVDFDPTDPGPWSWIASTQVRHSGDTTAERRIRMAGATPHTALAALERELERIRVQRANDRAREGRTA